MIRRLGFLSALLSMLSTGAVLAKDVNQPVKPGAVDLLVGYSYTQVPGYYDAGGDYTQWTKLGLSSGYAPVLQSVPVQVKYGLGNGFDVKANWDAVFGNHDAKDLKGLDQPRIGGKYSWRGGNVYANLTLPFATGNLDQGYLPVALETGVLARKKLGDYFRLTGIFSYTGISEKPDALRFSAQPEILWSGKNVYLDMEYLKAAYKKADLALVKPGIRADISHAVAGEVAVTATVAGDNSPAALSALVNLYWTFDR